MPIYNAAPFLRQSVGSVLSQSFDDLELIAIDDGSRDASLEIVGAFDDPRIRILSHTSNRGISGTMNDGIELAEGEFVAVMDADDVSLPERFRRQITYLSRHPDVAGCGMGVYARWPDGRSQHWGYPKDSGEIDASLLFNNAVAHPTLMIKRGFLLDHGIRYDEAMERAQDYRLIADVCLRGRIVNLKGIGCIYRIHEHGKIEGWQDKTRQAADDIRRSQLSRLGLNPSDADIQLHDSIAYEGRDGREFAVRKVLSWLDCLTRHNACENAWPKAVLDRVLRKRFRAWAVSSSATRAEIKEALYLATFYGTGMVRRARLLRDMRWLDRRRSVASRRQSGGANDSVAH